MIDPDAPERLLRSATDRHGRGPLAWAAEPLQDAALVLDVCCGGGGLAEEIPPGRWLGVDPVGGHRRPRLRGVPSALPLRANTVDGICLVLTLPRLAELDRVFAELRRVLIPGGTLVALVPSAAPRSIAELRLLRRVHRTGWRNRSALDRAGWLFAAADFALLADDRAGFTVRVTEEGTAEALQDAGLWPPCCTEQPRVGDTVPIPMRRLVARR